LAVRRIGCVGGDGLQRAPGGAVDVGKVGGRPVGGADRLADALGVADGTTAVRLVGARLGERYEPREEALELAFADPLAEQARAELLELVVVAPRDPERAAGVGELRLDTDRILSPYGQVAESHSERATSAVRSSRRSRQFDPVAQTGKEPS
jgi:hypothetical protein